MITVVCLSPSLDQTITLSQLLVGGTNRAVCKRTVAGGKGVNVAMMLSGMGEAVRLAVFRHADGSKLLFDTLAQAGVTCIPVDVPGTLRTNIKLLDASSDTVTEINAQSECVPDGAAADMEAGIVASCRDSRWLVLTGSMPKGYLADAYARMINRVRREAPECKIALDAEGEAFCLGVAQKPDFIKPNRRELEMLVGKSLESDEAVIAAARMLVDSGVETVIVSMDVDGSVMVSRDGVLRAQAIRVPVATTVGAGDALVSGYIRAYDEGAQRAYAYSVAAATARVAGQDGRIDAYLPLVQMR